MIVVHTFERVATTGDWVQMVACAEDVLAAARPWWAVANDHVRGQLADPLQKLSESVTFHKKHDRTPRPMHRMGQTSLMWACYRAAEEVRLNVRPDDQGADALWDAAARLAFITTGIKADVLAK